MQIGVMVGSEDPALLRNQLEGASDTGYTAVQLVPTPSDDIAPILADLARQGLQVVALGGYENPLQPGASALRSTMDRASAFGCPTVITWGGTANASLFDDHPDNRSAEAWRTVVEYFQQAARLAEGAGVTVAIEPFHNHIASTPERLRDLLDEIGSPNIAAVMDPPNFVKPDQIDEANERLPSMFDAPSHSSPPSWFMMDNCRNLKSRSAMAL